MDANFDQSSVADQIREEDGRATLFLSPVIVVTILNEFERPHSRSSVKFISGGRKLARSLLYLSRSVAVSNDDAR